MVLVALLLVLLFIVVIFFYMGMLLWMLFSPDYLLVIGLSGIFTADHMGWLTSSEKAHFIWAVLAMIIVGFAYHKLNHLLYSVSQRIYAIVSFPIVVVSSLILMLNFALKLAEKVAPTLQMIQPSNTQFTLCLPSSLPFLHGVNGKQLWLVCTPLPISCSPTAM